MNPFNRALRVSLLIACAVWCSCSLLISCLLSSDSESNLPACCRRNGTHRCVASMHPPGKGTGFNAPKNHCPFFPERAVVPNNGVAHFAPLSASHAFAKTPSTVQAPIETKYYSSLTLSRPKRGPPPASA